MRTTITIEHETVSANKSRNGTDGAIERSTGSVSVMS